MVSKNQDLTRGFTLVELLVVTTIIILLSAIGLVSFQNAGQNARNAKRKTDMETIRQAMVLYRSDEGVYPEGSYTELTAALISSGYLSAPAPTEGKQGHAEYERSDSASTTTFCLCATTEGSSAGNSSNTSCTFGTGDYYCVKNP